MKSLQEYIKESLDTQKVFVVLKPGFLNLAQTVINIFNESGWVVEQTNIKQLLLSEAKKLYYVHRNEDFYKDLCEYMASEPCRAFIVIKPGKQSKQSFEEVAKIKDRIREEYGESDMRNVLHSSDSEENMENEASIFFRTF
jgi:nucleoside diphosphate kinase